MTRAEHARAALEAWRAAEREPVNRELAHALAYPEHGGWELCQASVQDLEAEEVHRYLLDLEDRLDFLDDIEWAYRLRLEKIEAAGKGRTR